MSERKLLFLMNAEQALAFARLMEAANRGDGAAACTLGDMYREGLGGLRYSPKETYRWYAKSALTGDANGQNNLGACCEHGLGCVQSYAKAAKWYRLAAAQGLAYASSNLGYLYLRGHGVPADKSTALGWFEKALAQGDERAAIELERLKSDCGLRVEQPVPSKPRSDASRPEHSPADTQQARPCVLARCVPQRDGPPKNLGAAGVVAQTGRSTAALASNVTSGSCEPGVIVSTPAANAGREPPAIERPTDRRVATGESDQQSADRESARLRIRYLDPAEAGKHFGIVGTGGVQPPRPAPWEDEDLRVELLNVLRSEEIGGGVEQNDTGEASEAELFPIYAESGMVPGDFEEGTARRFEKYLKLRKQE